MQDKTIFRIRNISFGTLTNALMDFYAHIQMRNTKFKTNKQIIIRAGIGGFD